MQECPNRNKTRQRAAYEKADEAEIFFLAFLLFYKPTGKTVFVLLSVVCSSISLSRSYRRIVTYIFGYIGISPFFVYLSAKKSGLKILKVHSIMIYL